MDSVPLEMDDIFADHEEEDDNFPAPLPDLPEELEPLDNTQDEVNPSQDTENAEVLARLKDLSKGAARKTVRRPIPKLDTTRLTGNRGIPILPRVFKEISFKGKGHEAEDLKLIMGKLEHWAHRLFPKMPFDEVIEKIEKLGSKKDVQTCVKKMRLDMPLLDEDFVAGDDEDTAEANTNAILPNIPGSTTELDQDAEEAFDEMMLRENKQTVADPQISRSSQSSQSSPSRRQIPPITPRLQGTPVNAGSSTLCNVLTPEQMERIERNRKLAMEKKKARLHLTAEPVESPSEATPSKPESLVCQTSTNAEDIDCSPVTVSPTSNSTQHQGAVSADDNKEGPVTTMTKPKQDDIENSVQETETAIQQEEDLTVDTNQHEVVMPDAEQNVISEADFEEKMEFTDGGEQEVTADCQEEPTTTNDQNVMLESYPIKPSPVTKYHGEETVLDEVQFTANFKSQDITLTNVQKELTSQNENREINEMEEVDRDEHEKAVNEGQDESTTIDRGQHEKTVHKGQDELTTVDQDELTIVGQDQHEMDVSKDNSEEISAIKQNEVSRGKSEMISDDQQTVDELLNDSEDDDL